MVILDAQTLEVGICISTGYLSFSKAVHLAFSEDLRRGCRSQATTLTCDGLSSVYPELTMPISSPPVTADSHDICSLPDGVCTNAACNLSASILESLGPPSR